MAVFTDIRRLHMRKILAGRFDAVVAAHAVADDANMVERGRTPGVGGVAVVTGVAAVDMRRVFARRCDAIVTRAAGADDLCMVNGEHGREHVCVVAILANVACLDVRRILARGFDAVMAIDAVAYDIKVVEIRRYPAGCGVTVVAGIATRNMVRRLSGRREAVMTGSTSTGHLGMVDGVHRRKRIAIVAVLADVGCRYVRRVFTGRIGAIVAARTIACDIDVVEVGRYPAGGRMTIVTVVAAVQVSWIFPRGGDAVMTRAAGANDLGVIYGEHGRENIGRMAVFTNIASLDMCQVFAGSLGAVMAADTIAANIYMVEVCG